ncbi:MAG: hypothetical protein QXO86_05800 [Nitrososphaerota archaeon]
MRFLSRLLDRVLVLGFLFSLVAFWGNLLLMVFSRYMGLTSSPSDLLLPVAVFGYLALLFATLVLVRSFGELETM